jgi:UDP:flavonoid glycosyltransferase YjiC (YdhE family)
VRILLTTIGSAGDVHPFIAVALALKSRGHEVLLVANPYFKDRILAAGIGFWPLATAEEYLRLISMADLVNAAASPMFVFNNLIAASFEPTLEAIRAARDVFKPDVIVTHHISYGAHAAAELLDIPLVQCVLAPLFWFSREEPIALPTLPLPNAPRLVDRALRRLAKFMGRVRLDPVINKLRRAHDLPPIRDVVFRLARGGDGLTPNDRLPDPSKGVPTLALWSPHYRPRFADDPTPGHICGFATFDRPATTGKQFDAERDLLAWMTDGPEPVLITLGSSVSHHGKEFYATAAEACTLARVRALILTGATAAPSGLHAGVRAVPYAPYSRVMPRAAAIVHHAGIGTLAAVMRAGRPGIIVPFANDEFDNAARAQRLGISLTVPRRKLSAKSLAAAIAHATSDRKIIDKARALGVAMRDENGAAVAAEHIERLGRTLTQNSRPPQPARSAKSSA